MLNIAICDDDSVHRQQQEKLLQQIMKERQYSVFTYSKKSEFIQTLQEKKINFAICCLDIKLGVDNGIDLAKELLIEQPCCQIIYISSYPSFASDVYATSHVYFVLKEKIEEHFPLAIEKAITAHEHLLNDVLMVKEKTHTLILCQREILWIERTARKTTVHTKTKDLILTGQFDSILAQLNPDNFIRCHNSFVVNLNSLNSFTGSNIIMNDGKLISVSRKYRNQMYNHIIAYLGKNSLGVQKGVEHVNDSN